MTDPILLQRLEGAAAAILAATLFVQAGHAWWWLLALFLVVDLSAAGYLLGPRAGAAGYNAGHTWIGPLALACAATLVESDSALFVALVWSFHIGVDRALGYGLKLRDSFQDTDLGRIGRPDAA
jgi:hypothetical protein